jgi:hypothetical protein
LQIPNILEVIYAPQKAIKKIAEHPTIIAPILIILIYLVANVGYFYISASKVSVEQTVPVGLLENEWTQNSTLWTSNAQISQSDDFVNGTTYLSSQYYGNSSLTFSKTDSTQVYMQLQRIDTVNCSSPDGYDKLSFRVKWTSPSTKPTNVSVQLFSANSTDGFYKSLISDFVSSTSDSWNNETILLATEDWSNSSQNVDWNSITGLKMEFTWPESTNITVLVDGLFFHGPFISALDIYGTSYLLNVALSSVMQITITWIILSGLVYLLSKYLGGNLVWRIVLIATGTTLMTMVVLALLNAAGSSAVPNLKYPFELTAGFKGEAAADAAYSKLIDQLWIPDVIGRYGLITIHIWTAILCSVVIRVLAGFSWTKSVLIGAMAYVINLIIGWFLFGTPIY